MCIKKISKIIIFSVVFLIAVQICLKVFSLYGNYVLIPDEKIQSSDPELYSIIKGILDKRDTGDLSVNYDELLSVSTEYTSMLEKDIVKMVEHSANFINIGCSKGKIDTDSVYDIEGLTDDKQSYICSFKEEQYEGWIALTETLESIKMNIRGKYWRDLSQEEQIKIVQNMCIWDDNARHNIIRYETEKVLNSLKTDL